ncbi:MAG: transposase [Syntrophales bacterium]|nr:transposase [Syntrophales bacterium]
MSADDGMFTIDSSEIPKKGSDSAGVIRQYCGRLGKIENWTAFLEVTRNS